MPSDYIKFKGPEFPQDPIWSKHLAIEEVLGRLLTSPVDVLSVPNIL